MIGGGILGENTGGGTERSCIDTANGLKPVDTDEETTGIGLVRGLDP